ncbi:DUF11 domain-containing protein [Ruminococcaceae bacterium OttesenSCG-928-A11]|nr:DUF11 domain-containing protein [Ruminococcaceae bacterium OttesenSCG-928-A11]
MKKFSIKKKIGFVSAGICTAVALLVTVGVGLIINRQDAEAVMCSGADCSYFSIKKSLINNDNNADIMADSEYQYKITISADHTISQPVTVSDMLFTNIKFQRIVEADFGGYGSQIPSTNVVDNRLDITIPDGIESGQEITFIILAKAVQPANYSASTVESKAYVYSAGDPQCKTLSNAQTYEYDNCSSAITISVISTQLQIDKSIDGNYESYEDLHTGEEFSYTLTVMNNALGTYARDTITVYDEISPYLSNVRVTEILYFNKLVQGFDEDNNQVNADPPICTISSQVMKCVFNSLLYDDSTSGNKIVIKVAATPSAQYVLQDPDAYTIHNEAFVYSPSDSYCKTLANAQEDLNSTNEVYIGITDGKGGLRSRCRSTIDFSVIQPQLSITKEVNNDGRIWCYYKDNTWDLTGDDRNPPFADDDDTPNFVESNYNNRRDITEDPNGVDSCLNENAKYREPTEAEIQAVWIGMSDDEKDIYGWKKDGDNNAAAYQSFKASYKSDQANWVLISNGTPGGILDNSVHNGETLIYTLVVTNNGSGETKGDIMVTDQLDKNAFSDAGISIQPMTGGVDCSVKDLLVTCIIKRPLSNVPLANSIVIQIAATIENAGMIYNSAFVGGGGDVKCPIGDDGRLWCESNMVSTYITSPELHINKELRVDERSCPVGEQGDDTNSGDADPCWSLGDVIVDGSWAKYVIKVTNEGTANTSGLITVHDQIPDYLEIDRTTLSLKFDDETYNYASGLCEFRGTSRRDLYCRAYDTMEGGLLAKNGSWTIEFNVRVMQDVDITKDNNKVINYAYVWGGNDALCTNETIELSVKEAFNNGTNSIYDRCYDYLGSTIVSPKLSVKKSVSAGQVQAGKPFTYKISVDNIGDYDMPFGTTMVDILPNGLNVDTTTLPSSCTYSESTRRITCDINEKIVKNRPMIYEMTATMSATTELLTNKTFAYNKYDKDCSTELAASYTSRCQDTASIRVQSPVMKINMTTNILDTYVTGQVEYRIMVKNIGNMASTDVTTIIHDIPEEVRVLGVRAQRGVCYPDASQVKCELPAGIKAGETVNISVLTQVAEEGDLVSDVNLYGGGDAVCSVDDSSSARRTSWLFSTPVFAAETPDNIEDNTSNTDNNNSEDSDASSTTTDNTSTNNNSTSNTPEVIVSTDPPAEDETINRDSRCYDSSTVRAAAYSGGVLGINDNGVNSPMAGMLSITQAIGTITLLGAASYGLLKFGFVSSPIR